jgi:ornithine--oxo-acid transaminase
MAAGIATLREVDDQGLVERSARLGERLLELTRPLVERYEVAREVRGLGLMWAIEFGEPDSRRRSWRVLERAQPGIFAQLVVVPLFTDHAVLAQVAGHRLNVVKALPPLVVAEEDLELFARALEEVVAKAERMPRAMMGFALRAARASVAPLR